MTIFRIVCVGHDKFKIEYEVERMVSYNTTTGWFFNKKINHVEKTYKDWERATILYHKKAGYLLDRRSPSSYDFDEWVSKEEAKALIDRFLTEEQRRENALRLDQEAILANPPEVYP